MSIPDVNGFLLCGKLIPDIALENLFTFVPVEEILKLREVCQVWRDILSRRSFWKSLAERNGVNWNSIPSHIKEKEKAWIIFYSACKNKIFQKNFILNGSGHEQFAHWQKLKDGGDRMIVESPPRGSESLPKDPRYNDVVDSAFVFTYDWGVLEQIVDLKQAGLTKEIMRSMIPFQFVSTQTIGATFDCGGCFCVCLCLLDNRGQAALFNMNDNVIPTGGNWSTSTCTVSVVEELEKLDEIQQLAILICGKDRKFWAGHYGTKCSRISVTLKCLSPIEAEGVTPHAYDVNHLENARVFNTGKFWSQLLPQRSIGHCRFTREPRN